MDTHLMDKFGHNIVNLKVLKDKDGTSDVVYIGFAESGSSESSNVWSICKLVRDDDDDVIQVLWASSSSCFNKVWDNRATYSYN